MTFMDSFEYLILYLKTYFPDLDPFDSKAARFGGKRHGGRPRPLNSAQEFVLFRWRLCLGSSEELLARMFGISQPQVSYIFNT